MGLKARPRALAVAVLLGLAPGARAAGAYLDRGGPGLDAGVRSLPFPRLANLYLLGAVDESQIPALARWDLLVLSAVWTDAQLGRLRALNPDIKLFVYVAPYSVSRTPYAPNELDVDLAGYAAASDLFWYDARGAAASDWPNTWMVNPTDLALAGPAGTWRTFLVKRVLRHLETHPQLDGVFVDNLWESISWAQSQLQLDSDCNPRRNPAGCDGRADLPAALDSRWNTAMRALAADLRRELDKLARRRGRDCGLVANGATDYFESVNGSTIENFPRGWGRDTGNAYGYNWNRSMLEARTGYLDAAWAARPWPVSILNAGWWGTPESPSRSSEFERHKRFTLASALLGDGFYSLDRSPSSHSALWWEPEYDLGGARPGYLGAARGPAFRVLQPSGPELLPGGDFRTAALEPPWVFQSFGADASLAFDASAYAAAAPSARITVRATPGPYAVKLYAFPVPVVAGTSYTLRFWARAAATSEVLVHLYAPTCPGNRCFGDVRFRVGKTWKLCEYSFVASADAEAGLNLFYGRTGTLWLDDLSLRAGDTSLYRRDFQHGIVLLNYTRQPQAVPLGGTFQRPSVPGSSLWDGALVTSETIPPSDGRVLLRLPSRRAKPEAVAPEAAAARLLGPSPNPCNPGTRLRFALAAPAGVRLEIVDVAGRRVRTLVDGPRPAGTQEVDWDGRDASGTPVASGAYLCTFASGAVRTSAKLVVLE